MRSYALVDAIAGLLDPQIDAAAESDPGAAAGQCVVSPTLVATAPEAERWVATPSFQQRLAAVEGELRRIIESGQGQLLRDFTALDWTKDRSRLFFRALELVLCAWRRRLLAVQTWRWRQLLRARGGTSRISPPTSAAGGGDLLLELDKVQLQQAARYPDGQQQLATVSWMSRYAFFSECVCTSRLLAPVSPHLWRLSSSAVREAAPVFASRLPLLPVFVSCLPPLPAFARTGTFGKRAHRRACGSASCRRVRPRSRRQACRRGMPRPSGRRRSQRTK